MVSENQSNLSQIALFSHIEAATPRYNNMIAFFPAPKNGPFGRF